MPYLVSESTDPHERADTTATRTYFAEWNGTGPKSENLARGAVLTYLSLHYQDATTGEVYLPAAPEEINEGDRTLLAYLHGLPYSGATAAEVEGTEDKLFKVSVTWSRATSAPQEGEAGFPGFRTEAVDPESEDATVTLSRTLSGSARAQDIDYAPVVGILRSVRRTTLSENGPKFVPPYTVGSVGAKRAEIGGRIEHESVTISPPQANYVATCDIVGGVPKASFVKKMIEEASDGVMNSDEFTLGGSLYARGQLLFVDASVTATTDNAIDEGAGTPDRWTMQLGFAIGKNRYLEIGLEEDNSGSQSSDVSEFFYEPEDVWFWYTPQAPTPDSDVSGFLVNVTVSPFDYVWRFIDQEVVGGNIESNATFLNILRPFRMVSFQDLFGTTSL